MRAWSVVRSSPSSAAAPLGPPMIPFEADRLLEIHEGSETLDGKSAVAIRMRDRGVGLSRTERDRLFEAFYTTKPSGMGMGLAISRSIIEAHGGRMWVEPNTGPGATFAFSLPAA